MDDSVKEPVNVHRVEDAARWGSKPTLLLYWVLRRLALEGKL